MFLLFLTQKKKKKEGSVNLFSLIVKFKLT